MEEQKNTISGKANDSVLSKVKKLLMFAWFLALMFVAIYTIASDKEIWNTASSQDHLYERWQSEPKELPVDENNSGGGHISFD